MRFITKYFRPENLDILRLRIKYQLREMDLAGQEDCEHHELNLREEHKKRITQTEMEQAELCIKISQAYATINDHDNSKLYLDLSKTHRRFSQV